MRFSPSWRWPVPFGAGRLFVGCIDYLGIFRVRSVSDSRNQRKVWKVFVSHTFWNLPTDTIDRPLIQRVDSLEDTFFFLKMVLHLNHPESAKDHYRLEAPRDGSMILGVSFPYLHGLKASYKNLANQRGARADYYTWFSQKNVMHFKIGTSRVMFGISVSCFGNLGHQETIRNQPTAAIIFVLPFSSRLPLARQVRLHGSGMGCLVENGSAK